MDDTTIAEEVLAYVAAEGIELSEDLTQAEGVLREQMFRIGARALELHLARHKLGYEGSSRPCACGASQRFVDHHRKVIGTLLGQVALRRAYYRCSSCGASSSPYDEKAGLGSGQISMGLAKAATLLAIDEPFESSSRKLRELTGQRVSERTIERLTHQAGQVAQQEEEALAKQMETWSAPAAEATPDRLYVAVDGVMVHENDGYHEAKTAICYWNTPDGKQRESRYAVRFESAAEFAAFVWMLACRCGLKSAKQVVLLGDGAKWIWEHIAPVLEGAVCIVDWYHAMEHVWECGRNLWGEDTEAMATWVKSLEALLRGGNVREILQRLEDELKRTRAPTKREAIQKLITYVNNQDDRLAYDKFLERGFDIGSGRVEAACKSIVAIRMKRSGMRWSRKGSQATLSLRVVWKNGAWDAFWAKHPLTRAA